MTNRLGKRRSGKPGSVRFAAWGILGIALLIFAYGVFLSGGEESAPEVGSWMIGLAAIIALGASLLLLWGRKRRSLRGE